MSYNLSESVKYCNSLTVSNTENLPIVQFFEEFGFASSFNITEKLFMSKAFEENKLFPQILLLQFTSSRNLPFQFDGVIYCV